MRRKPSLFLFLTLFLGLLTAGCQKELKAPNGLPFSIVKDYQNWALISISYRQDLRELHIILGNRTALEDFLNGIPDNGHPFTDGAVLVRLVYPARPNSFFNNDLEPDGLRRLDFMVKDAERFKTTMGWGYASFSYDEQNRVFKPFGENAETFNKCLQCHKRARTRDYVFTPYTPKRPK